MYIQRKRLDINPINQTTLLPCAPTTRNESIIPHPNERSEKNNAMADIPSQTFKDRKFAEAQKIKRPTLNIIYLSPRIIHGKITGYLQR